MINWSVPLYIKTFIVVLFFTFLVGLLSGERDLLLVSTMGMGALSAACFVLDGVKEMLGQLVRPPNSKE